MIRPNFVGTFPRFTDPTLTTFSAANLAAIDSAVGTYTLYPHAYTATVAESYDERIDNIDTQNLLSNMKVGFGLFLTADNTRKNLLFNCVGHVSLYGAAAAIRGNFVFGRAKSDTVTSSVVGVSNELDNYMVLPSTCFGDNYGNIHVSINTQVLGMYLSGGKVWFFGFEIGNYTGSDRGLVMLSSLSFSKFNANTDVYAPDRN